MKGRDLALTDIEAAKKRLLSSGASLVLSKDGSLLEYNGPGISSLVSLLNSGQSLKGYSVADKVVGKAAALLMVYGGAESVYAEVISIPALSVFKRFGTKVLYKTLTDFIENSTKTGLCPMEQKALPLSFPEEAAEVFLRKGENR